MSTRIEYKVLLYPKKQIVMSGPVINLKELLTQIRAMGIKLEDVMVSSSEMIMERQYPYMESRTTLG